MTINGPNKVTATFVDPKEEDASLSKFASYGEYARWSNNQVHYLDQQRNILMTILFDPDAHEFLKQLAPSDFRHRSPSDWREEKGMFELLATVAFDYWEQYAEPPCEIMHERLAAIPGLGADASRIMGHIVERMALKHRELQEEDERVRGTNLRYSQQPDRDDEPLETTSARVGLWEQMRVAFENYVAPCVKYNRVSPVPRRISRSEERRARKVRVEEMLYAGQSRREIAEETGYTEARISQIAAALKTAKITSHE